MDKSQFSDMNFLPEMTWQSLPQAPEQSRDWFLNPDYDHSAPSSITKENMPSFVKSMPVNPNSPEVLADRGFSERDSGFSSFGRCSFSGRTGQLGLNGCEYQRFKPNCVSGDLELARVSSNPSLGSNCSQTQVEIGHKIGSSTGPYEGSSVSEQILIAETEAEIATDSKPGKRKPVSKGKSRKEVVYEQVDRNSKRCKISENKGTGNDGVKKEGKDDKQNEIEDEANEKAPEPAKDYIHVRARRGQATDSHSLAERVRREKISERMKLLQDLLPGCNKVTGKALMLDEIINYVQSLQCQVEFLSMKLASVDPLDFNTGNLLSKDITNSPYAVDSSSLFGQPKQEIRQAKTNFVNGPITHCSPDPSDTTLCRDISLQLTFVDEFCRGFPQFSGSYGDDLQSIVQMGLGHNPSTNPAGSSDATHMSIELRWQPFMRPRFKQRTRVRRCCI